MSAYVSDWVLPTSTSHASILSPSDRIHLINVSKPTGNATPLWLQ